MTLLVCGVLLLAGGGEAVALAVAGPGADGATGSGVAVEVTLAALTAVASPPGSWAGIQALRRRAFEPPVSLAWGLAPLACACAWAAAVISVGGS